MLSRLVTVVALWLALPAVGAVAQDPGQRVGLGTFPLEPLDGLYISFTNNDPILTVGEAETIVRRFIDTYPKECVAFRYARCTNQVRIVIQPGFDVPCGDPNRAYACTRGAEITIATEYLRSNRSDYDLITHEAMHVVQFGGVENNYIGGDCGYWVEGLADVARDVFGLSNGAANWFLAKGDYRNGYRETAHFLRWVEAEYDSEVSIYLDGWLRARGCPTDDFWTTRTGVSLAQLVAAYNSAAQPVNGQ